MITARFLTRTARAPVVARQLALSTRYNSTAGYGDPNQTGGAGKGGKGPRVDLEHPGPPPVEEGKGTGSGGAEETGPPSSSDSGSGKQASESSNGDNGKPKPKINDQQQPGGSGNEEVERHNREMANRYGKRKPDSDEKVGKDYWKGTGGVDRDP
ncbi:hypothetical protein EDC01DRAFT_659953 [Geopyxis carbonaria]|nr:hypothetical protein EDC01DRAFT_659953 [Geopyxis carbonaria]